MPASPDPTPERLAAALLAEYGVRMAALEPLALGEDAAASVARVRAVDGDTFFLKLRRTMVPHATLAIPAYLHERGVANVVAPLPTRCGALSIDLGPVTAILYPFIDGDNAYERRMDADGWRRFGATLRRIHETILPPDLERRTEREDFAAAWIADARRTGEAVAALTPSDDVLRELAARWREHRPVIERLIMRAQRLAESLRAAPPPLALCHANIHLWNLMVDDQGGLWIVDWDDARLAPKECDLIFGIGGIGAGTVTASDTESFLRGYGATDVNPDALAFYRHHRALTDIESYTRQALAQTATGAERAHALGGLRAAFAPGSSVDLALAAPVPVG